MNVKEKFRPMTCAGRLLVPTVRDRVRALACALVGTALLAGAMALNCYAVDASFAPSTATDFPVRPGRWSWQRVAVRNTSDVAQKWTCVTHAASSPLQQFAREANLPAHAERRVTYLALVPESLSSEVSQLTFESQLESRLSASGASSGTPTDQTARPHGAIVDREGEVAGLIVDADAADEVRRFVQVARVMAGLSPRLYTLSENAVLPGTEAGFSPFDSIVLASEGILDDPQAIDALRLWLHRGGRLWTLLDKTPPEALNALLGDAWKGAVLERATTAEFRLVDARGGAARRDGDATTLLEPAQFVWTHSGDGDVLYRMDQWPAAFRRRAGQGMLMATTLSASGWTAGIAAKLLSDPSAASAAPELRKLAAGLPLGVVARSFFHVARAPAETDALHVAASQLIGYQAIGRSLVGGLLGSLCGATALVGFVCHRMGRAAWGVALAPIAALVVAAVIAKLGHANRVQLPAMCASMETVEIVPGINAYLTRGAAVLYRPDAADSSISGSGGLCRLRPAGGDDRKRRWIWSGVDQWEDSRLRLPAGATKGEFTIGGDLAESTTCEATMSRDGIAGRVELGRAITSEEAVLSTGWGPELSVRVSKDGTFLSAAGSELPAGRYTNAALVDDTGRRREKLLAARLASGEGAHVVPLASLEPTLYCWTEAWGPGISGPEIGTRVGEALAAVPVRLTRPSARTEFAIPAALLPFESTTGPDGTAQTSAYSNAERKWVQDLSRQSKISLRFQFPPSLLPFEVQSVALGADLHAPGRMIEVSAWRGTDRVKVFETRSPLLGRLSAHVDDKALLQLDRAGGLVLSIDVGAHAQESAASLSTTGWRIDRVFLTATAIPSVLE